MPLRYIDGQDQPREDQVARRPLRPIQTCLKQQRHLDKLVTLADRPGCRVEKEQQRQYPDKIERVTMRRVRRQNHLRLADRPDYGCRRGWLVRLAHCPPVVEGRLHVKSTSLRPE